MQLQASQLALLIEQFNQILILKKMKPIKSHKVYICLFMKQEEAGSQPRSGMSDRKSSLCLDDYFWNRLPIPCDRLGGVLFKVVIGEGDHKTHSCIALTR